MDEELDLGTTHEDMEMPAMPAKVSKGDPKKCYPQFSIRDKAYAAFKKKFGPQDVNDELTATVRLRVCGVRADEYGSSMELEVKSILGDAIEEEAEDDSKEDAVEETGNDDAKEASVSKRKKALEY